MAELIQGP